MAIQIIINIFFMCLNEVFFHVSCVYFEHLSASAWTFIGHMQLFIETEDSHTVRSLCISLES